MGILKGIFKGKVKTDEIVTASISGIDKLFYTKEEKADDDFKKDAFRFKVAESLANNVESTLSENTIRSKARRGLTYIFSGIYALLLIVKIAAWFLNKPTVQIDEMLTDQTLTTAIIMILAFHFGGYYATGLLTKFKEKPKEKEKE